LIAMIDIDLVDDGWIERLWKWGDENEISDYKIPRNKEKLLNLTKLHLLENQLTELPKEIGNLSNLRELNLGNNQLTELPKEIGNLTNLTKLDLWNNQFTELPKKIANLSNLTRLSLRDNQLTELPKEITNLTNLTKLGLKDNPNLILTGEQKKWTRGLISKYGNGWLDGIAIDDDLLDRDDDEEIPF
jgi:Leucine-rich repeat (LRR) protein